MLENYPVPIRGVSKKDSLKDANFILWRGVRSGTLHTSDFISFISFRSSFLPQRSGAGFFLKVWLSKTHIISFHFDHFIRFIHCVIHSLENIYSKYSSSWKKITGRMNFIHAADTFLISILWITGKIFLLIERVTGRTLFSIENITGCIFFSTREITHFLFSIDCIIPDAFFNSISAYRQHGRLVRNIFCTMLKNRIHAMQFVRHEYIALFHSLRVSSKVITGKWYDILFLFLF